VKILVIDDHSLVREGLCQVLKGLEVGIEVLQARTCEEAFAQAYVHTDLDLALLDNHLPDLTGLEALAIFGQRHPELPILVLSGSADTQLMQKALQAGAAGYVSKSTISDELLRAIRCVLEGGVYGKLQEANTMANAADMQLTTATELTQRQELVLQGLLDGRSNRDIARDLFLSEETVKTHVASILRYFKVQNRTQAVIAANRAGYKTHSGAA
jgi:DNA-binding NarL/FixJ family response regulator